MNDRRQSIRAPKAVISAYSRNIQYSRSSRYESRERHTVAMGGKYTRQYFGSANFLISSRGTPIDSKIWNWYVRPVDFAATFDLGALLDVAVVAVSGLPSSSASSL